MVFQWGIIQLQVGQPARLGQNTRTLGPPRTSVPLPPCLVGVEPQPACCGPCSGGSWGTDCAVKFSSQCQSATSVK